MAWGRGRGSANRPSEDPALIDRVRSGERVLAASWVDGRGDFPEAVAGTARALYLPDDVVLDWNQIDQAMWRFDESTLNLVTLPIDGPARAYQVRLADPGRLPELVRERVTSSIVVNQKVPLEGYRGGAKIIARRQPGIDDLDWIVIYDDGVDGDDPDVIEHVRHAVAVLRRDLGV